MATKPTTEWNIDEMRVELLGRAVADPEIFVDQVILVAKKHPEIVQDLMRTIIGSGLTRKTEHGVLPKPTDQQLAAVRKALGVIKAVKETTHPKPLTIAGQAVIMDAAAGDDVVILGGSVVSVAGVASLIRVDHVDEDLDQVSEAIASQYGGPVTRKSLTRKGVRITPGRRALHAEEPAQDLPEQVVLAIQAVWSEAGDQVRSRNEEPLAYAKRLFGLCGVAAKKDKGESARSAKEAIEMVRQSIPATAHW